MDAQDTQGLSHYYKEQRPWGNFERLTLNETSTVKIITVNPGEEFSLQTHAHRDEYWRIMHGSGEVTIGTLVRDAKPDDNYSVMRGVPHRVKAGPQGITFVEIALGDFDENDITRLEDKYGRS